MINYFISIITKLRDNRNKVINHNYITLNERVSDIIISKDIKLITLTVTEKGYHSDKDKKLNYSKDIINDLENKNLNTVIGHISFGLIQRFKLNKEKIIIMSCDNLSENSNILKNLIYEFLTKIYPQCLKWFLSNVEFPLSMVDGIVPVSYTHLTLPTIVSV